MNQKRNREAERPVIAQYDVRGIQNFIFRTNKLKEIIGASHLIDNLFEDMLSTVLKILKIKENDYYLLNWKRNLDSYQFDDNVNIQMEILYANAGNAMILYRSRELCIQVNKALSKLLLQSAPDLKLAIAIAPKTNHYANDYRNLIENMHQVKTNMPFSSQVCYFPFVKFESSTGFPQVIYSPTREEYISQETYVKLNAYDKNTPEADKHHLLDYLVEEKGESSLIAVVHIDGNNMGSKIGQLMNDAEEYKIAIPKIKYISNNINTAFNEKAFSSMMQALESWMLQNGEEELDHRRYFRPVINAGDDITFICTAKLALSLCKIFLNEISKYSLIGDTEIESMLYPGLVNKFTFSACAGIAIINSHFPFKEAYNAAEKCCEMAKKKGKQKAKEKKEEVGNWIDFQILRNMHMSSNIERERVIQYSIEDGTELLIRPYCLAGDELDFDSFQTFENHYKLCSDAKKIPIHWAKEIRDSYRKGRHSVNLLLNKMKASGINLIQDVYTNKGIAIYYDVLEMLDLYIVLDKTPERNIENETISDQTVK